jgi:hypothetical protein
MKEGKRKRSKNKVLFIDKLMASNQKNGRIRKMRKPKNLWRKIM